MSQYIDMENWKRKNHYQIFSSMEYPFFNICANLDITNFYRYIKENNENFFILFLYFATKAANEIEEFRYRIREEGIYINDIVNPSFTIMSQDDLFSFCYSDYFMDFSKFRNSVKSEIEKVKVLGSLEDEPRDDCLYITSLPWISFTSVSHPISLRKNDSIPRISWGKYFDDNNGRKQIPLSVSLHHGLADGVHVGKYFALMQKYLDNPGENLID